MINKHIPLATEEFGKTLKNSLLNLPDADIYKSITEIQDIDTSSPKIVHATVVAVYIDSANMLSASECAIILQSIVDILVENNHCKDVQTIGYCVVGIFDTPFKQDIDSALESVGKINSMFNLVNKMREQKNEDKIKKCIGMAYGKLLLTAFPNAEGSIYNWSGETMETALKYSKPDDTVSSRIYVAYSIYNNLKEDYQKLFSEDQDGRYVSNPINIAMDRWIDTNI